MLQGLRFFVSLALLIAVPVQGMAAVAGSLCMALGGHGAPTHATAETPGHDHHGDAAGSSHDHGSGQDDIVAHSHCGPCVACCASAAIAGALIAPLPAAIASAPPAASSPSPETPRRDKLDRPPLAA